MRFIHARKKLQRPSSVFYLKNTFKQLLLEDLKCNGETKSEMNSEAPEQINNELTVCIKLSEAERSCRFICKRKSFHQVTSFSHCFISYIVVKMLITAAGASAVILCKKVDNQGYAGLFILIFTGFIYQQE